MSRKSSQRQRLGDDDGQSKTPDYRTAVFTDKGADKERPAEVIRLFFVRVSAIVLFFKVI